MKCRPLQKDFAKWCEAVGVRDRSARILCKQSVPQDVRNAAGCFGSRTPNVVCFVFGHCLRAIGLRSTYMADTYLFRGNVTVTP